MENQQKQTKATPSKEESPSHMEEGKDKEKEEVN
jgi:hypothetical protein